MGPDLLENNSVRKDLGGLVDDKLTMSPQCPCGQEGQWHPGVHQESVASRWGEVFFPLCSALIWNIRISGIL